MLLTTISPIAEILGNPQEPGQISDQDSQLLYGEQFQVEESHGTYVYGYSVLDGYKGYVERALLVKDVPPPNAIVKSKATHLYPEPDFKSRPNALISFLSRVTMIDRQENGFTALDDGHWVFTDHIAPLDGFMMPEDLAHTATFYLGTPYIYGGRSIFGLDCSGLIQQIMMSHGYPCPKRDSADQQGSFGNETDKEQLARNDIVFFRGHVGIMMDDRYVINATARHMTTVIEDVRDLEEIYGGITYVARL
ncbi:MAG TPA: NlpC/P60 family protein [Alphaproteobacteria bacterium]|nr:NlpC/P60 family protein [Alphaproteobacteria bacterium]